MESNHRLGLLGPALRIPRTDAVQRERLPVDPSPLLKIHPRVRWPSHPQPLSYCRID
jgi:hypothetical protein